MCQAAEIDRYGRVPRDESVAESIGRRSIRLVLEGYRCTCVSGKNLTLSYDNLNNIFDGMDDDDVHKK